MKIHKRNKRRQAAGIRTGRVFFVPAVFRATYRTGLFYKQAYPRKLRPL